MSEASSGSVNQFAEEETGDEAPKRRQAPTQGLAGAGLAALGIVFGDIGTSPLYTLKTVLGDAGDTKRLTLLGSLSLLVWTLIVIATVKYVGLAMRADNEGEGGILALMSLIKKAGGRRPLIIAAGLFGAALIYGDGVITPAISVLSALEGLPQALPAFKPYVLPATIAVLLGLFLLQPFGTARIGKVFGPVMLLWFAVLAALGAYGIAQNPAVLAGLNPWYGLDYLGHGGFTAFALLGSIFLCTTGAEALYADMGHFGKQPIRLSWFSIVFPALVLNYAGQAAIVLKGAPVGDNIFYQLCPPALLVPLVLLATVATIIASQAIITGSFSMTRQAVQLGWLPRMVVQQTSDEGYGQIYVGGVNWLLMLATVALALAFRTSDNLSAAYGMAVSTTMLLTTVLLYNAMREIWGWPLVAAGLAAAALFTVDLAFFGANLLKVPKGGWVPLVIAFAIYGLMRVWHKGAAAVSAVLTERAETLPTFFARVEAEGIARPEGTAVFLSKSQKSTPPLLAWHVRQNRCLYRDVLILTAVNELVPRMAPDDRFEVRNECPNVWRVLYHVGFMERVSIDEALPRLKEEGCDFDLEKIVFYVGHETVKRAEKGHRRLGTVAESLFETLERNQAHLTDVLELPSERVVEIGRQIEL